MFFSLHDTDYNRHVLVEKVLGCLHMIELHYKLNSSIFAFLKELV